MRRWRPGAQGANPAAFGRYARRTAFLLELGARVGERWVVVGFMHPSGSAEPEGPSTLRGAITVAAADDARMRGRQDRVLFPLVIEHGVPILTANAKGFDFLLQLMPKERVVMYRRREG